MIQGERISHGSVLNPNETPISKWTSQAGPPMLHQETLRLWVENQKSNSLKTHQEPTAKQKPVRKKK